LEVIEAFGRAAEKDIPYQIVERRPGDVAENYADPVKARLELGWKSERGLEQMVRDMWRWQENYPTGFPEEDSSPSDEQLN
ncbi:GDP-mannose 4,6-dehydratase, partial [Escherichia coli]|nr:GDP-mannose 4,6-dehydratase [Escherichia coli]